MNKVQQDMDNIKASLELDRLDAERYRWLRINSTKPVEPWSTHTPESFDAMVDGEIARRDAAHGESSK